MVGCTLAVSFLSIGVAACGSDGESQGVKTPPESTIGQLGVTGQWARATIADAKNTALYFTVVSAANDRLTGVSVDASVAARARVLQRHRVLNLMTHIDPWRRPDLDHPVGAPAVNVKPLV